MPKWLKALGRAFRWCFLTNRNRAIGIAGLLVICFVQMDAGAIRTIHVYGTSAVLMLVAYSFVFGLVPKTKKGKKK